MNKGASGFLAVFERLSVWGRWGERVGGRVSEGSGERDLVMRGYYGLGGGVNLTCIHSHICRFLRCIFKGGSGADLRRKIYD